MTRRLSSSDQKAIAMRGSLSLAVSSMGRGVLAVYDGGMTGSETAKIDLCAHKHIVVGI